MAAIILFASLVALAVLYWLVRGEDSWLANRLRGYRLERPKLAKKPSLRARVDILEKSVEMLHDQILELAKCNQELVKTCSADAQLKHLHGAYRKLQSEAIAMGKELNDLRTEKADRFTDLEVD